jgi:hypothetical protein
MVGVIAAFGISKARLELLQFGGLIFLDLMMCPAALSCDSTV